MLGISFQLIKCRKNDTTALFSNYVGKDNSDLESAVNKQLANYLFEHSGVNYCLSCTQVSKVDEQLKFSFSCASCCDVCKTYFKTTAAVIRMLKALDGIYMKRARTKFSTMCD